MLLFVVLKNVLFLCCFGQTKILGCANPLLTAISYSVGVNFYSNFIIIGSSHTDIDTQAYSPFFVSI